MQHLLTVNNCLRYSRAPALTLITAASFANAGNCTIHILGNVPEDNVGLYSCDENSVCTLIDSHFDPEAENTPLQADEFEVDIGGQTINSSPAQNGKLPNSALNNCDDGFGGSSGGGTPTLPPVVATASYIFAPALYIVRTYNRVGNGVGNGGSTPMRAGRKYESPVRSEAECLNLQDVRAHAALAVIGLVFNDAATRAPRGTTFTVPTRDGFKEQWKKRCGN